MTIDITQIIIAVIGLIGVIITGVAVPLIKTKLTQSQWDMLMRYAIVGVQAAEIIIGEGKGEEKLRWVSDYIERRCREHGIKTDMDSIRIAIESAWKDLGLDKNR